ncbi:MAG TPA: hypothetical protein VFQ53_03880 [Kofleriaceae bacterium]|nr:hypothetical protein [Kofleriaceae bacterium]
MKLSLALVGLLASSAFAGTAELDRASVIYVRGTTLYRSDGRGKNESELAALPAKATVRALRTDAAGTVLLADLAGKWSWMPLDGSAKTLAELPCGDGPASLQDDGSAVVCRAKQGTGSVVIQLKSGKQTAVAVPAAGARLFGTATARKLVWADKTGIWGAPPEELAKKTQLAPEAPLRSFVPSLDGTRAVGVYNDYIFEGRKKVPAEVLVTFALDGKGARRKGIRHGVPLDWSHDNQYVLVQEGAKACLMRANGGQYKCWRGFTAVSLAPDGSYALVLGGSRPSAPPKKQKPAKRPAPKPGDEPQNEPEDPGSEDPADDDVAVAPPSGPLSLYRAKLDGPYDTPPELVTKNVDGAAVWVPGK